MAWATAMGLGGGLVMVLFFSVWPAVFGRRHLGRIQGVAQALTVLASAVGPLLLAWCVDLDRQLRRDVPDLFGVIAATAVAALVVEICRRRPSRRCRRRSAPAVTWISRSTGPSGSRWRCLRPAKPASAASTGGRPPAPLGVAGVSRCGRRDRDRPYRHRDGRAARLEPRRRMGRHRAADGVRLRARLGRRRVRQLRLRCRWLFELWRGAARPNATGSVPPS